MSDTPQMVFAEYEARFAALRLSLAAALAREAKMREALRELAEWLDNRSDVEDGPDGLPVPNVAMRELSHVEDALATPADDGALREMLTQVARAAMSCGGSRANAKLDFVADLDVEKIVDNAMGGGA